MARHDVADLVRHDAGEHVGLVRLRDQAAIDVDVAARKREGVDGGVIDDLEVERPACQRRARVEPLADAADVLVEPRVAIELDLLIDLRRQLIAELPLLIERHRAARPAEHPAAMPASCRKRENENERERNRETSVHR